jgi:hypothetical protein
LNPYSAISLLRSSSAFFLAFLFLHKKNPIKNAAAMTTIGMMTAIAIFAPEPKPSEEDPDPEALNAEGVGVALVEVRVVWSVAVADVVSWENVDVTTTTEGGSVVEASGVVDGVWVMVAVTSTTLGLEVSSDVGGTTVVDGGMEVTEVMVVGSSEDVSGVEVVSEAVTVTVVEKEVVRLVTVVSIVVRMTESVTSVLVSVDIVTRGLWKLNQGTEMLAAASRPKRAPARDGIGRQVHEVPRVTDALNRTQIELSSMTDSRSHRKLYEGGEVGKRVRLDVSAWMCQALVSGRELCSAAASSNDRATIYDKWQKMSFQPPGRGMCVEAVHNGSVTSDMGGGEVGGG